MGPGGISIWQLFLIFLILVLAVATMPLRHDGDGHMDSAGDKSGGNGAGSDSRED